MPSQSKGVVKSRGNATERHTLKISGILMYITKTEQYQSGQPATYLYIFFIFPDTKEHNSNYVLIESSQEKKVKNPLDPGEKNPFVYDSSDSEEELESKKTKPEESILATVETKSVWKENLFFSDIDNRLKDGLDFFSKSIQSEGPKERRGLKSVMKKRIYNKERKNQMFQKKIGGRKKTMKKTYKKKS